MENTRNRNPVIAVKDSSAPETIELVREGYDGEVRTKKTRNSNQHEVFVEKEFLSRSSLLTDLLETKHIRPIYNFWKAAFLIQWLHLLVCSFLADGSINLGLRYIFKGFAGFEIALMIWVGMQTLIFLLFFGFKLWAVLRLLIKEESLRKRFDVLCTSLYVFVYLLLFPTATMVGVQRLTMGVASSVVVMVEMLRLLMKTYAFVRSNASRTDSNPALSFKNYTYFLFAPTLIYRDEYPRDHDIRWNFVIKCFTETLGGLLFCCVLFELYVAPVFENFGRESITKSDLMHFIFDCVMTASSVVFVGFYSLLHSWMNGFAELLRFADRMFYKDWWTARSFTEFLSACNVIVADWTYFYVYQDLRKNLLKNFKLASMAAVMFCLAWLLESILATSLLFIYPVFSCCFIVLMLFSKTCQHWVLGNFWFWVTFSCVSAMIACLYIIEFYARLNCPVKQDTVWDFLRPVSWHCNGMRNK